MLCSSSSNRRHLLVGALALTISAIASWVTASPVSAAEKPIAVHDAYSVGVGGVLDIDAPGVMGNDTHSMPVKVNFLRGPHHGAIAPDTGTGEGTFTYKAEARYIGLDTFEYCLATLDDVNTCASNVATVIIRVGEPTVTRIGGADRYEVAAHVAQQTNPTSSDTVLLASGQNFPDALSAAPAATALGAALLLVQQRDIPDATEAELVRLRPSTIVVVGGPATVSDSVVDQLERLAPTVTRISGADRFEVSRNLAIQVIKDAPHAFVATGANFPDALTAGAVAGAADEPVLLVNGTATGVDAVTKAALVSLGTQDATIVGGPNSVSTGLEAALASLANVDRISGIDRYDVAVQLQEAKGPAVATPAYIATGLNYPDALVGGRLAGEKTSPLYIVPGTCVPATVLADLARVGAEEIVLLGGPNSLDEHVADLEPCR
jgi:putative cell wall-binding protein